MCGLMTEIGKHNVQGILDVHMQIYKYYFIFICGTTKLHLQFELINIWE